MRNYLIPLVAAAVLGVSACKDSTATGSGTGKLTVQLTDAPFPFGSVSRVDVFVVSIDGKNTATTDADAADPAVTSGWTTIASPNSSFNLLDLRGGVVANLGTTSLATGTYNGFRLILDVSKSSVTLTDGTHPTVMWPSAAQTGIKINLDQPISVTQDSSVMVLDFDVGRSFVMRGNSISQNGLLFKPVIRAVATQLTGSVAGSVRGDSLTGAPLPGTTVEVLVAGAALTDTVSADVVRSSVTDANGAFKIDFLLPGTYVLRATPLVATTYHAALLAGGVTIASGTDVTGKVIVVTK